MRTLLKLMCVAVLCALPRTMVAQMSFTISYEASGGWCSDVAIRANAIIKQYMSQSMGIPTREACESARATVNGVAINLGGCSVRLVAGPCTGRPIAQPGASSAIGGAQQGNPSQGTAYFSNNPSDEVSNWAQDNAELLGRIGNREVSSGLTLTSDNDFNAALQTDISSSNFGTSNTATGFVLDPDKPFVSLNMRHPEEYTSDDLLPLEQRKPILSNVENYLAAMKAIDMPEFNTAEELSEWLSERFKDVSGYDVASLMEADRTLTDEEKQALTDYAAVVNSYLDDAMDKTKAALDELPSEEKNALVMAIMSKDVYGDPFAMLAMTGYKQVHIQDVPVDNPMYMLANAINECNKTTDDTGFHAELYFNEKTGEYTVSFEGSSVGLFDVLNFKEWKNDWLNNNVVQGLGGVPPQFMLAATIANTIKMLPSDARVNITGHSLGGGLASLAGLITQRPTYTFNPEGVNDRILASYGVSDRVLPDNNKISMYYSDGFLLKGDVLTKLQDGAKIVKQVNNAALSVIMPIAAKMNDSSNMASTAIGTRNPIKNAGWHPMDQMVNAIVGLHPRVYSTWNNYSTLQQEAYKADRAGTDFIIYKH